VRKGRIKINDYWEIRISVNVKLRGCALAQSRLSVRLNEAAIAEKRPSAT